MAIDESFVQSVDNKYVARFSMGDSLDSYSSVITYELTDEELNAEYQETGLAESILKTIDKSQLGPKRRDTSVGGNDAVNCYYQFNENDDIVHPINRVGTEPHQGLGRVYNEVFDEQQQIMYMSFGVPDFTSIDKFLDKAFDTDLANLMNKGESTTLVTKVAGILGKVVGTVIVFPFLPIKFIADIFNGTFFKPTKYFDFKPTMSIYYKQINIIMAHLAVNMNIIGDDDTFKDETEANATNATPSLAKKHGLDILRILAKKHGYDGDSGADTATDTMFKALLDDPEFEKSIWGMVKDTVKQGAAGAVLGHTEAMKYVGFRIEKTTDSSESATNNTKETELAKAINGQVSAGRDRTFNMATLTETSVGAALKSFTNAATAFFSGAASSINLSGGIEVLKGAGFVDIPEIWESSSFSKSYSFDFQLRTPYADKYSIFYSLYIPLAMMMAAALPRSVGQNAYTSPFLVRAYSKGMFAIPLGIIDSITIKRGAAEYGWAKGTLLPTQIDISFSIKDLSPVMHVALGDGGLMDWFSILGQNSTFQEYLLTLSGQDIANRTLRMKLAKNRAKALMKIHSNNLFNPMMLAYSIANTLPGNLITRLNPISRVPGNFPKLEN